MSNTINLMAKDFETKINSGRYIISNILDYSIRGIFNKKNSEKIALNDI